MLVSSFGFVGALGGSSGECLPKINSYNMAEGDYVQFGPTTFKLLKIHNNLLIDYIDVNVEGTNGRVYMLVPKNINNLKISFPFILIGNFVKVKVELNDCIIVPELDEINYSEILSNNEYSDFFSNQMTLLMSDYWSDDGNWKGDIQNDATAFAPALMFKLYQETGNEEFYLRGMKTVNYQKELLKGLVHGEEELNLDFIVGFYSLLSCMDYAKDKFTRDSCNLFSGSVLTVLDYILINDVLSRIPEKYSSKDLDSFVSNEPNAKLNLDGVYSEGMEPFIFSFAAWVSLEYYERTKINLFLSNARKLIEKNEKEHFNPSTGLFEGESGGWSESAPLIAYSKMYLVSKDKIYLEKADNLIESLKRERKFIGYEESAFADYYDGGGIFCDQWGNCDYVEVPVNDYPAAVLSTHIQYIIAFFELYKATNDAKYLELARNFIDFGADSMNLYEAYPGGIYDNWFNKTQRAPFVSHDISYHHDNRSALGRRLVNSPIYCTGDNFYFLIDLLDYKKFIEEISEGNCGDGIINIGEVCDRGVVNCIDDNGYSGTQNCNAQCNGFDTCTTTEYCGDNIVNGLESCDGSFLECTTVNNYSGTQNCNVQCNGFDVCTTTETCVDNDGFNTIVASSVFYKGNQYLDECVGSKEVKEYYCGFSIWKMARVQKDSIKSCEFGCSEGACINQKEEVYQVCNDNDPSNDLTKKGRVVFEGNAYEDKCEESGLSVRQYFCSQDKLRNFVKRCEVGSCIDGICR